MGINSLVSAVDIASKISTHLIKAVFIMALEDGTFRLRLGYGMQGRPVGYVIGAEFFPYR